jgi:hypothetical protein
MTNEAFLSAEDSRLADLTGRTQAVPFGLNNGLDLG